MRTHARTRAREYHKKGRTAMFAELTIRLHGENEDDPTIVDRVWQALKDAGFSPDVNLYPFTD